jgi:membrane fusion protein (multidrug efflux system)
MPSAKWIQSVPGVVWRVLAFVIAGVIVLLIATQWTRWEGDERRQRTEDAYLQSDLTPISAKVPGYVRSVPVQDYERVHAGQVIAQLVDDDYRAAVAQSLANVAVAQAQIGTLEAQRRLQQANVQATQAVLAATAANLSQNDRDVRRAELLLASGSGSTEATEHVNTVHAQLIAQQDQDRALIEAAQRQLNVLTSQLAQARATLQAQNATLDLATINLGYTTIRAPQDGMISQRQVFPGQYLGVGGQVTTLTPLPRLWVIANYRETQLTHVRVGQRATVTVDSFPGHTLHGHVVALSPASGAQFALLPPDNATGNFTKIVQRFSVKIVIDDADGLRDQLLPGMSVVPTIDTRSESTPRSRSSR